MRAPPWQARPGCAGRFRSAVRVSTAAVRRRAATVRAAQLFHAVAAVQTAIVPRRWHGAADVCGVSPITNASCAVTGPVCPASVMARCGRWIVRLRLGERAVGKKDHIRVRQLGAAPPACARQQWTGLCHDSKASRIGRTLAHVAGLRAGRWQRPRTGAQPRAGRPPVEGPAISVRAPLDSGHPGSQGRQRKVGPVISLTGRPTRKYSPWRSSAA